MKQTVVKEVKVPKIVKVPKYVPQPEIEYVDKYVSVPQVEYRDQVIETPEIKNTVTYHPKLEYIDIPRDEIDYVPKVETRIIEKHVNTPGEYVEITKPKMVFHDVPVPYLHHKAQPVPVTQVCEPIITLSTNEVYETTADSWIPRVVPYDIYVPKLVDVPLYDNGDVNVSQYPVNVPWPHMRELEAQLNPMMEEDMRTVKQQYYPERRNNGNKYYSRTKPNTMYGTKFQHNLSGIRSRDSGIESARTWFPGYGESGQHLYVKNSHPAVMKASYR